MLKSIIFHFNSSSAVGTSGDVSVSFVVYRWPIPGCIPDHSGAGCVSAHHGCDEPVKCLHA